MEQGQKSEWSHLPRRSLQSSHPRTQGHPAQIPSMPTRIGPQRPKATQTQEQKLVSDTIEMPTGKIVHATSCRAS